VPTKSFNSSAKALRPRWVGLRLLSRACQCHTTPCKQLLINSFMSCCLRPSLFRGSLRNEQSVAAAAQVDPPPRRPRARSQRQAAISPWQQCVQIVH
jgi:hypothetical protein